MPKTEEVIVENPEYMDYRRVMYWEPESKELLRMRKDGSTEAATLLGKAQDFLEQNCIKRQDLGFVCLPIKGYNKTTYRIRQAEFAYEFECNCQGYRAKIKKGEKGNCSHIVAVKQFIFIETYNNKKI